MAKSSALIQKYARMGAQARLAELNAEIVDIERAFPDLAGGRRSTRPTSIEQSSSEKRRRTRKPMSAAQRKAVGDRMRRYWAARRRAAGKS